VLFINYLMRNKKKCLEPAGTGQLVSMIPSFKPFPLPTRNLLILNS
jgi:hypothetical protein